jgi:hypothetical protein
MFFAHFRIILNRRITSTTSFVQMGGVYRLALRVRFAQLFRSLKRALKTEVSRPLLYIASSWFWLLNLTLKKVFSIDYWKKTEKVTDNDCIGLLHLGFFAVRASVFIVFMWNMMQVRVYCYNFYCLPPLIVTENLFKIYGVWSCDSSILFVGPRHGCVCGVYSRSVHCLVWT